MLLDGHCTDMTIQCEEKTFDVHKFVLSAHSDVFRAMFSNKDCLENIQSLVNIEDSGHHIVGQMLEFMYSGEVTNNENIENLSDLLKISEKYHVEQLKAICEEKLIPRSVNIIITYVYRQIFLKLSSNQMIHK